MWPSTKYIFIQIGLSEEGRPKGLHGRWDIVVEDYIKTPCSKFIFDVNISERNGSKFGVCYIEFT
jgi:hypothetical protein